MRKLGVWLAVFMSMLVLGLLQSDHLLAEDRSVLAMLGVIAPIPHLEINIPQPFGPPKPDELKTERETQPQMQVASNDAFVVVPVAELDSQDAIPRMERLGTLTIAAQPQGVNASRWLQEGELINLERKSPQAVIVGQKMKFVATLVNDTDSKMNLVAQVVVRKGDGSEETLIPNYGLQLGKGKSFRVPVGMAAKEKRFPPGLTKFIAFLRDKHGQLVDEASITFMITVPFER